jgi:hypothetical protein
MDKLTELHSKLQALDKIRSTSIYAENSTLKKEVDDAIYELENQITEQVKNPVQLLQE